MGLPAYRFSKLSEEACPLCGGVVGWSLSAMVALLKRYSWVRTHLNEDATKRRTIWRSGLTWQRADWVRDRILSEAGNINARNTT